VQGSLAESCSKLIKNLKPPRSMCAVTEGNFLTIPCIGLPAVIPEREGRWLDVGRRALDLALETSVMSTESATGSILTMPVLAQAEMKVSCCSSRWGNEKEVLKMPFPSSTLYLSASATLCVASQS
jgi:hypothetical protein